MARAVKARSAGTGHAARDGGHTPPPVRQGELSLRQRRRTARAGGSQLFAGQPGPVGDVAGGVDRAGAGRDGTLPRGTTEVGGAGERGLGGSGQASPTEGLSEAFAASGAVYGGIVGFLGGSEAAQLTHDELEARLEVDTRALMRQLYQDHLDLRSGREQRARDVVDAMGVRHNSVESGHDRPLETIFGPVRIDYTWSITSGSLPVGLTLTSTGTITGTPTTSGTQTFTVKVTDSSNPALSATRSLTIKIT